VILTKLTLSGHLSKHWKRACFVERISKEPTAPQKHEKPDANEYATSGWFLFILFARLILQNTVGNRKHSRHPTDVPSPVGIEEPD